MQFKHWSFHVPNLIPSITAFFTNMQTLKFKSCLHNCVFHCRCTWKDWQLIQLSSTCLIWVDPWIKIVWPTWEFQLWSNFVSNVPNLMHNLLQFIFTCKHFRPLNIVKINWVLLIILSSTSGSTIKFKSFGLTKTGIKFGTCKDRCLHWAKTHKCIAKLW